MKRSLPRVYLTSSVFREIADNPKVSVKYKFKINKVDYNAVLIPSAPVPFGGSLVLVPSESVQAANLSVEKFINIYLSMGSTGSQFIPKSE